jgi:HEAT repeat protein
MKPRYVLPLILVSLLTPCVLLADRGYTSKEELIYSAEIIVLGTIEKVEKLPAMDQGKYISDSGGNRANVKSHQIIMGSPGKDFFIFHPRQSWSDGLCALKPGKYLMFLEKENGCWVVTHGPYGLVQTKGTTIEWYNSKSIHHYTPDTYTPQKEVLKDISNMMVSQKAAKKQFESDLKTIDGLLVSPKKEKRLKAVEMLELICRKIKLPYGILIPHVSRRVIKATEDEDPDVQLRALSVLTYKGGGKTAMEIFRKFSMSNNPEVSYVSVIALKHRGAYRKHRGSDALMNHLLSQLQDASNPVPHKTIRAIGCLKRKETIDPLFEVWDSRLNSDCCDSFLSAFQRIGKETSAPLFKRMIDPKYKVYADRIARRFRYMITPELKESMLAALKSKDKAVRRAIALSLGLRRVEWPVEALSQRLMDTSEDPLVKAAAAESLACIGTDKCVALLLRGILPKNDKQYLFTGNEETSIDLLGCTRNPKAFSPLIELLKNDRKETVIAAAIALGVMYDRRASRPLLALLNRKDATENRTDMRDFSGRNNIRNAVDYAMIRLFYSQVEAAKKARSEGKEYDWDPVVRSWEQSQIEQKAKAGKE